MIRDKKKVWGATYNHVTSVVPRMFIIDKNFEDLQMTVRTVSLLSELLLPPQFPEVPRGKVKIYGCACLKTKLVKFSWQHLSSKFIYGLCQDDRSKMCNEVGL